MDMPPPEPERIVVLPITARELAHETGYDVATICHWAKAGVIPVIRKLPGPRGAYLIDPRAVGLVQHKERKAPRPGPRRGAVVTDEDVVSVAVHEHTAAGWAHVACPWCDRLAVIQLYADAQVQVSHECPGPWLLDSIHPTDGDR